MSQFRCSGCRTEHQYTLYAVAQLSQGYAMMFTGCACGKETTLTPAKYREARKAAKS